MWTQKFHLFRIGYLELTPTGSSWSVAITDSVLRATKNCYVLQSTVIHSHSASVTVCANINVLHVHTYMILNLLKRSSDVEKVKVNFGDFFALSTATNTRGHKYKLFVPSIRQKFFVDGVINVWNALPSTVNFTSLNVLGTALKRLIFLVFLFVCNILLVW